MAARALAEVSIHPEALTDLLTVPARVRDQAIRYLDRLARGEVRGPLLEDHPSRQLSAARKIYLDEQNLFRLVYMERRAAAHPRHLQAIHVIAIGERRELAVYESAARRLRPTPRGLPPRFQAALAAASRSPGEARTARAAAAAHGTATPRVVSAAPAARRP
ncbi:hypothetical protein ABZW30_08135 [Kitasatospora sp. NPDC004669]|uniref:hypothetical protein n=1 Tax=Kitasatospora sp. NPDC004669 TaxID=3154555 RepID=UPI0033A789B6